MWAPVLLRPIFGSPEQFVIGVGAANEAGSHVEAANSLRRLTCLYGRAAETAIFAAQSALFELETRLAADGPQALLQSSLVFSSVAIGDVRQGEAHSLQSLARTWMSSLSSLHEIKLDHTDIADEEDEPTERGISDRLPALVFEEIVQRRPGLGNFFSEEIQRRQQRRSRSITRVSIDFAGSHLVANFATLRPSQRASSVDRIKRKVFDLIVRRDEEHSSFSTREHEMIVYSPARNDPSFSAHQVNNFEDDLQELNEQSLRENIGFRSAHSVTMIADRLLTAEEPPPAQRTMVLA